MLLAMACLGDTSLTLYQIESLDPTDERHFWHELHLRDMPTGVSEVISYEGENDAVMAFVAAIAADEPEKVEGHLEALIAKLSPEGRKKFLP